MAVSANDKIVRGADLVTVGSQVKAKLAEKVSSENIDNMFYLTSAEYEALATKDPNTIYVVTDGGAELYPQDGEDGEDGKSAYQIWLDAGNVGTEADFLASLKGDTGVSADYPISVHNGLDSTATDEALAAAQGKLLNEKITELNQEASLAFPFVVNEQTITDFSEYTGQNFLVIADGVYGSSSSSKHIEIPIKEGQRIKILSNETNGTRIAFYWDLDYPASGAITPYVLINDAESVLIPANTAITVTAPEGAKWLIVNTGSTSTSYTPQYITIVESTDEPADAQLMSEATFEGGNLEDPQSIKVNWTIDSRTGRILRQSSNTKGITDYIPVNGGDLYCNNRTDSGTYGRSAVYDENKAFLRSFNTNQYTYQEGDAYVRFTVSTSSTQLVITRPTFTNTRPMGYDETLVQKTIGDPDFIVTKEQVPELAPALGLVGLPGIVSTVASMSNETITLDDAPKKLKPNVTLSFYGKITDFGYIELGCGKGNNTGWGLRVTSTNVSAIAYNNGASVSVDTKTHGLTIGTFIYVVVNKEGTNLSVKVTSFGGEFVNTVTFSNLEAYGTPFAFADSSTTLSDVKFGWISKDLRKPIWFFGASYMSLYNNRMLTQLKNTYGVDTFAIIAEAGNDFDSIWPSVIAALNYGTPKYLVCGIGMNTEYPSVYWEYMKRMQLLCKERGIIPVFCTIPWPEGGSKSVINGFVRDSGERYIDLYKAVSSDDSGTWYSGYCDDGVHPTLLGAKAMAARIMLDLPEILDY